MSRRALNAGSLRHVIEIQERTEVRGASGDPTVTWTLFKKVRASVEPLLGKEYFASQQRNAQVQTRFRIRAVNGVVPRMRIVWKRRWYDIESAVLVNGVDHEMVIMANELVEYPAQSGV